MGSNGSKEDDEEEGLPAKYARGITSAEFAQQWRNNSKYKELQEQLANKELSKSCISIYGDKLHESDPSVMLLSKSKLYNPSPRLQAIGVKQKSYVNQLIEHRSKFTVDEDNKKKHELKNKEQKNCKENRAYEPVPVKNVIKNSGQLMKQNISITNNSPDDFMRINCSESKKKDKQNKEDDGSSSSDQTSSRPSSPSWTGSNSEESSLEGNISVAEGLEHIRSDMTVVPYDQAKARFESGTHKKRLKRSEDYVQLEQLGLGFWNNDQWVPTKVVTLAISDQLSCAGGDWPTNYRYRNNFNCQSYRSTFSEVQY